MKHGIIRKPPMRLIALGMIPTALALFPMSAPRADNDKQQLRADPGNFVGKAGDCGTGYPAGSNIVTSAWLAGMGLPDDGTSANTPSKDPHKGLLLSKNGPTADCSAAGAVIRGFKAITVTATSALGFDYRNGGHCGAGAPRFNVVADDGFHFVGGCANGTATPAPQDPAEWTRVRFTLTNPAQAFPPLTPGAHIKSVEIVHDEGTDAPSVQDPNGVGLAVVDNIFINGEVITRGNGNTGDANNDSE